MINTHIYIYLDCPFLIAPSLFPNIYVYQLQISFDVFGRLFIFKNVLVENHGILSVILYYTQVIIQPDIKTLLNQMQMDRAYSMVQHVGLIVVP